MPSPKVPKQCGRTPLAFVAKAESTKDEESRVLARAENSLEKLIRAAEKEAHKNHLTATAKVLLNLREQGEAWAAGAIGKPKKETPSMESALELKTRFGLSKAKYQGVRNYAVKFGESQLFPPWEKVMELRNMILPNIEPPFWEDEILTVDVKVRELAANTTKRILDLDHVTNVVSSRIMDSDDQPVQCVLIVNAGLDSATGYAHHNQ
ncbi:hypothetical protein pipiens_000926, partial [Culex pipiens pipiens]